MYFRLPVRGVGQETQVYTTVDLSRYAPGGDIFSELESKYGRDGATRVYQASVSGNLLNITDAIAQLKAGGVRNDSTASIFFKQITTDPFAAPFSAANTGIGTILGSALKGLFSNPWVLLVGAAIAAPYVWPQVKRFVK